MATCNKENTAALDVSSKPTVVSTFPGTLEIHFGMLSGLICLSSETCEISEHISSLFYA